MVYTETVTYIHDKETRKVLAAVEREYRLRKKLAKAQGVEADQTTTPRADAPTLRESTPC
jgi:hypothetical protein